MASMAQRNGHGRALRTAMRGALTVNRRNNKRNLMVSLGVSECKQPPELASRRLSEQKVN
jgi:hypothetical protein